MLVLMLLLCCVVPLILEEVPDIGLVVDEVALLLRFILLLLDVVEILEQEDLVGWDTISDVLGTMLHIADFARCCCKDLKLLPHCGHIRKDALFFCRLLFLLLRFILNIRSDIFLDVRT